MTKSEKKQSISKKKKIIKSRIDKEEDIPLYHKIQIGSGYNIDAGEHTQMNIYISDEALRASEEDRLRRMNKIKKIEEDIITIKPDNNKKKWK